MSERVSVKWVSGEKVSGESVSHVSESEALLISTFSSSVRQ